MCAYSLESCRAAEAVGADRVELCAAMYDGGTTPSAGMIRLARKILQHTRLYVMIRPRGGDFCYSDEELEVMREEIRTAREAGVDGVVIGLLRPDGTVDRERTAALVREAAPLPVTFHRAFDMTADHRQALEDVIASGCVRILTSGGRNTAVEGIDTIRELAALSAGRIQLMAGSGVNGSNAAELLAAGADALHTSGRSVRDSRMLYRNPAVFMGGVPGIPEYEIAFSDPVKLQVVADVLRNRQ